MVSGIGGVAEVVAVVTVAVWVESVASVAVVQPGVSLGGSLGISLQTFGYKASVQFIDNHHQVVSSSCQATIPQQLARPRRTSCRSIRGRHRDSRGRQSSPGDGRSIQRSPGDDRSNRIWEEYVN